MGGKKNAKNQVLTVPEHMNYTMKIVDNRNTTITKVPDYQLHNYNPYTSEETPQNRLKRQKRQKKKGQIGQATIPALDTSDPLNDIKQSDYIVRPKTKVGGQFLTLKPKGASSIHYVVRKSKGFERWMESDEDRLAREEAERREDEERKNAYLAEISGLKQERDNDLAEHLEELGQKKHDQGNSEFPEMEGPKEDLLHDEFNRSVKIVKEEPHDEEEEVKIDDDDDPSMDASIASETKPNVTKDEEKKQGEEEKDYKKSQSIAKKEGDEVLVSDIDDDSVKAFDMEEGAPHKDQNDSGVKRTLTANKVR
eukprot:CAMPEP_0115004202 /NCGR_PEP_ID=MMETSP0216-20121206/19059_1 /TAXON_ID=223996 /ORGANISM="Protocruzia adherens, Strain Boccale" /LENGTH=308 /DNA_ID=CAMNT_0002370139 /DNA_START=58 /DNA_END=984 /DNA_ORIENTATION=-